jgi:hypothetical protein
LKGRQELAAVQRAAGPVVVVSNGGSDVTLECGNLSRHRIRRLTAQPPFDRAAGPTVLWASGCEGLPPLHMAVGVSAPIKTAATQGVAPRSIRRSSPVETEVTTFELFHSTGNISKTSENILEI